MENTSESSRRALWRVLGAGLVAAGGWLTLSLVLSAGSASAATGEDLLSDTGPAGSLLGQTTQTVDSVGGALVAVAGIVPPVADQVLTPVATTADDLIAVVPVVPALLPDRPVAEVTTTVVDATTGAVGAVGGAVGAVPGLDDALPALPALPSPSTLPAIPALPSSASTILPVVGLAPAAQADPAPTVVGPSAAVLEGRASLESAGSTASPASTDKGNGAATAVPSGSSPAGAPAGVPSPIDGAVPATPTASTSGGTPAGGAADDAGAIRVHLLPRTWSGVATSSPVPAAPTYDSDTTPD